MWLRSALRASRLGSLWHKRMMVVVAFGGLSACELTETLLVDETEVILVASYVIVTQPNGDGAPTMIASARLSRSNAPYVETDVFGDPVVQNARVAIVGANGRRVRLQPADRLDCQLDGRSGEGRERAGITASACYRASTNAEPFAPGEQIALQVTLADGRLLFGDSRIPGAFSFLDEGANQGLCRVEPKSNHRLSWTPSENAWAYLSETNVRGLDRVLTDRDFEVPDSVYLSGLSIGEEDTDIVYPRDLAGFSTFDDESEYLFELLRELHGAAGIETATAGGGLLQGAGGERRCRAAFAGPAFDLIDDKAAAAQHLDMGLDCRFAIQQRRGVAFGIEGRCGIANLGQPRAEYKAAIRARAFMVVIIAGLGQVGFDSPIFDGLEGLDFRFALDD